MDDKQLQRCDHPNCPTNQRGRETLKVITVRLPASLHQQLRNEAHQQQTSMNQLCIAKLMQPIPEEALPS